MNATTPKSDSDESAFDKIWERAWLYRDEDNKFIQELKIRGRYQGLFFNIQDEKRNVSDWEDRRSRLGIDAKFWDKKLELRFDFEANDGFKDVYAGLVDAYLRWKPDERVSVTAGRQKPMIAYYGWYQPWIIQPYIERSQIFNQLGVNRVTGMLFQNRVGTMDWSAGIYSNDMNKEFGRFAGGYSVSFGAGLDLKKALSSERALIRIDWLHSEREEGDDLLNRYDDIITSTYWWSRQPWEIVVEGYAAQNPESAVLGGFVQPSYEIIKNRLKLVARYSAAAADTDAGLRAQRRYESRIAGSKAAGDLYQAFYAGFEYKIYGDNLKFLLGGEKARLEGEPSGVAYDGITLMGSFLIHF